jgi:hypothetical protein
MGRQLACALIVGLLVAACTLVVGADSVQCSMDSDCASRGGMFAGSLCKNGVCVAPYGLPDGQMGYDAQVEGGGEAGPSGPWSCLGTTIAPVEDATKTISMAAGVTDFTMKPLTGMTVNVCYRVNPLCDSPVVPAMTTDANGMVAWTMPYAARVFLMVTGPGYLQALSFLDPPPTSAQTAAVTLLTAGQVQGFAALVGDNYDQSKGILFVTAEDCRFGPPAAGVHYQLTLPNDASASNLLPFYVTNGSPDCAATETTSDGSGGYVNVPPGLVGLTGVLPAMGNAVMATNELQVASGAVTYAVLEPYEH